MRAHLAHGQHDHASSVLRRAFGQFAARDLGRNQPRDAGGDSGIGKAGQRAGHGFERPDTAQIGQCGDQRDAPFHLPQMDGQRVERDCLQFCHQAVHGAFGVFHGLRQPVAFARHQPSQIGAAPGGSGQQIADVRRKARQLVQDIRAKGGVIRAGATGYATGNAHARHIGCLQGAGQSPRPG